MANEKANPLERVLVRLRLKRGKPTLTRQQILQIWPIRNPALKVQESEEGIVTIELPRRRDWLGSLLAFLFSVPASRPVELDEVGSLVWRLCDGEHTVDDIATTLCREYKLNRREVEVSLFQYLQTLARRGIVGFAVPKEIAEAAGLQGETLSPPEDERQSPEAESALSSSTPASEAASVLPAPQSDAAPASSSSQDAAEAEDTSALSPVSEEASPAPTESKAPASETTAQETAE